jgi:phosphoribosylanthranilate isomerase
MRHCPEIRVKICGITNKEDALLAASYGADAVGLIFCESRRQITPYAAREIVQAVPPFLVTVGVFMDQPLEFVQEAIRISGVQTVQLHGTEIPEYSRQIPRRVIKRIRVSSQDTGSFILDRMRPYSGFDVLLDPGAGEGKIFNWRIVSKLNTPFILAGGLTPDNVWAAIRLARPSGVDVSSGVEAYPGKKDPEKLKAFLQEVKT